MLRHLSTYVLAVVAVAAAAIAAAPATADEIYLRARQSGLYVSAGGGGLLAARAARPGNALKLDKVRLDGIRVAFRVIGDGTYVRAGVGRGTRLATGSPHIRGWETFELVSLGSGVHALRSVQNGKWVRVGGREGELAAVQQGRPSAQAEFELVPARSAGTQPRQGVSRAVEGTWSVMSVAAHQTGFLADLGGALRAASRVDIRSDGNLAATFGCNRISARIAQHGETFRSTEPFMTRMGCPGQQGVHAAERSFAYALRNARKIYLQRGTLILRDNAGRTVMLLGPF